MKAAPPRPDRRADVSPRVLVGVLSVTAGSPTVYVRPAPNDRSPSLATQALEPPSSAAGRASATGKQRSTVVVVNELAVGVRMVWVDFEGEYQNVFATVPPGGRHALRTYVGHVWRVERDGDVATAPTCTGNTPLLLLPPPFAGTVWFTPRLILPSDPTALASLVPRGRGARTMFDRRTAAFGQVCRKLAVARAVRGRALRCTRTGPSLCLPSSSSSPPNPATARALPAQWRVAHPGPSSPKVDAAWIFDAAFGSTGHS